MQAIILAAGLGSRLGDLTRAIPKALIEVDDRPLIDYALAFAAAIGIEPARTVVVGGFCYPDLRARIDGVAPAVRCIDNPAFRKGNLVSLRAGLPHIDAEDGFLVMNTDHIYRPAIAAIVGGVMRSAAEVTAFCDFDRPLGDDDMKVALDDQRRVRDMAKTLSTWDAGYVGMTCIPGPRARAHAAAGETAMAALGDAIHVESVLVQLVREGTPPVIADISGHGWLEVDQPDERDHAAATLRAERWWSQ
ncbi:MAG TPA: NTP transferase domain-containing protein [Kofleriaceae bacterium]|nr:NTP transferase domain-containing protein [Kofleriaceae bacterium]